MNKSIAILTHFYRSKNYGGVLQAYALSTILINNGYNVDVLNLDVIGILDKANKRESKFKSLLLNIKSFIRRPLYRINTQIRIDKFITFQERYVSSSKIVYDDENIEMSLKKYEAFITGSDQVWNLNSYIQELFLDFVPSSKKKISYAASIGMEGLTDAQKNIFKNSLKDFDAVSVREKSDVELIKDLSPVPVVNTLDPTLLLTREDWNKVCADRVVDDRYIFCYFLGNNEKERKLAMEFAKQKKLKIISLPHMCRYQRSDKNFGDYQLWNVGPEKFISLIKHAEYIFTDSFHAVVFSNIYHKQYFVFNRSIDREMSSRIYNITDLFDEQNRYCDTIEKETIDYIKNLESINYDREFSKFEETKKISIDFLKNSLGEPDKEANED